MGDWLVCRHEDEKTILDEIRRQGVWMPTRGLLELERMQAFHVIVSDDAEHVVLKAILCAPKTTNCRLRDQAELQLGD